MKYYETHYEEYIHAVEQYNMHPELDTLISKFPPKISQFGNLILYGPSGIGKYSQLLRILKKYSPSELKYDKKMTIQTEKQQYTYRISDIHYEIEMSLLGCNSKFLWHEIFAQIVDIVSIKTEKVGIIVCKNFHNIHNELLEIFYSYMQQYNHPQLNLQIKFVILTEHISFLPNSILNNCFPIQLKRPEKECYVNMIGGSERRPNIIKTNDTVKNGLQKFQNKISNPKMKLTDGRESIKAFMNEKVEMNGLLNAKEVRSFSLYNPDTIMPKDIFNTICNSMIEEMNKPTKLVITEFRDIIYEILIYNLDAIECVWYILSHFIEEGRLSSNDISDILKKTHTFLKYYNNNYRPIYHLESIFFYIITKLYHY